MNPRTFRTAVAASLATCALGYLATAGPLNPPAGPVASTYKTLSDVEPRIAINATNTPTTASALFSIGQPGSYYLTGNVTGVSGKRGIEILVPNVSIDLNGFTVSGVAGSTAGIYVHPAASRVNVRNGTVVGWGYDGIDGGFNTNGTFEHVTAMNNGASIAGRYGIRAGSIMHLRDCIASSNTGGGISVNDNSELIDCSAVSNTGNGFAIGNFDIIRGSNARSNGATGFLSADSNVFENCVAGNNGGAGMGAGANGSFTACTSTSNSSDNFGVGARGSLVNCTANSSTQGHGISFTQTGGKAIGCSADSNFLNGIDSSNTATITNCATRNNSQHGLHVGPHSRVADCLTTSNLGCGILCDGNGDTEIVDNTVNQNGYGLNLAGIQTGNIAVNCRVEHNMVSGNYQNMQINGDQCLLVRNSLSAHGAGGDLAMFGSAQAYGPFVFIGVPTDMTTKPNALHPQANFTR